MKSIRNIIQIDDISKYRSELMGWSILWIMMLHFGFYDVKPLGFIAQYGYAGVEIFMFVSGFGLFFSLDKSPTLFIFFRHRFIRIFPAYYIVGFLASFLMFHDTVPQYLYRYSTIGFWARDGIFGDWFIPSIVLLYLIVPLFKKIGINGQAVIAILFLIVSFLLVESKEIIDNNHYFLLYRIPAFLFGMICARWAQQKTGMKWYYITLLLSLPFFVWLYPQFHRVYRYKYFSVLFMMPIFICSLVFVSKYIKVFNPIMRKMGEASLEIYLTQGLFFYLIIHQMIKRSEITTFVLIVICSISAFFLHGALQKKRHYYLPSIIAYMFIGVGIWYATKWQPILQPAQIHPSYKVAHHSDDTLRIAMYGDSWVGMHPSELSDSVIAGRPIAFHTCGQGGLTSGEVYELMFYRSRSLLIGPDYCIVIAGINDASANVGVDYYCTNYRQIIEHLLTCQIRPVIVEIPDVDLKSVYGKKPIKDLLCDSYRAFLTASHIYDVAEYRKSLYSYLELTNLNNNIIYISKDLWNPGGYKDKSLYLDDNIHLNVNGYRKLDSCILNKIKHDI